MSFHGKGEGGCEGRPAMRPDDTADAPRGVRRSLGHSRSSEQTVAARQERQQDAAAAGQALPRVWREEQDMPTPSPALPDLSKLEPANIDELWAQAMQPAYRAQAALAETRRSLGRYRRSGYKTPAYLAERVERQQAALDEAIKAGEPFDAEYERRGGWTRYLIVVGSNGHVHRSPGSCGSLIPGRTLVQPVFALSGRDDDGVVADCGHVACSKCFPDAPVITREQRERASADKRAAKAAEREAKRREKLARAAKRARTLLGKVEAFYAEHGGREQVMAMDYRRVYDLTMDQQQTVMDTVIDDWRETNEPQRSRWNRDPRQVIAEADALGLL